MRLDVFMAESRTSARYFAVLMKRERYLLRTTDGQGGQDSVCVWVEDHLNSLISTSFHRNSYQASRNALGVVAERLGMDLDLSSLEPAGKLVIKERRKLAGSKRSPKGPSKKG